jgi:copper oxidase (laccase) domain-containing protein
MIMAVHAGWRGLTAGILNQAINIFREHGLRDIKAVIGPSIGPCCFEVREDVVEAVSHGAWGLKSPERIIKKTDDTWHIDLAKGAGLSLQDLGVAHVETSNVCTKHDVTWFSFRRQKKVEGSNYAWIGFASAVNSASTPST